MHDLAVIDSAEQALIKANSIEELSKVRIEAETLRMWAKKVHKGMAAQNRIAEIKVKAERKTGQILKQMEKQKPGEYKRSHDGRLSPSLKDLGINFNQSHRWQQIADLPEEVFQEALSQFKNNQKEITSSFFLKLSKQIKAQKNISTTSIQNVKSETRSTNNIEDLTGQKFGAIYIDPPWQYGNQITRGSTDNHYPTMSLDKIRDLPIPELSAEQCHLHLWTTNGFLEESLSLIRHWGFTFKSTLIWAKGEVKSNELKIQLGMGNYWRGCHEILLLGVKGKLTFPPNNIRSVQLAKRGSHSAKPSQIRDLIEQVSPAPYLEMFGRETVKGWTVFGNQVMQTLDGYVPDQLGEGKLG